MEPVELQEPMAARWGCVSGYCHGDGARDRLSLRPQLNATTTVSPAGLPEAAVTCSHSQCPAGMSGT
jgi:hypothetical protein